jgi:ribonuclease inhibitor
MEVAMEREIDGARIYSESDFHQEISSLLDFGEYYGHNLDALWDRLSADVERPLTLIWKNSAISMAHLGDAFDAIVDVLQRVKKQDEHWGLGDRFDFVLT